MSKYKEIYTTKIEQIGLDKEVETVMLGFIENYKEEDNKYFNLFMMSILTLLKDSRIWKIKAEGYDKIKEINGDFNENIDNLQKEYAAASELDTNTQIINQSPPTNTV